MLVGSGWSPDGAAPKILVALSGCSVGWPVGLGAGVASHCSAVVLEVIYA
jgi:hypothetical protein